MTVRFQPGLISASGSDPATARALRLLLDYSDKFTPEEAAAKFVQLFPIGSLRESVRQRHNRSGRLWQSLRLEQRGGVVNLRGRFYANFGVQKQFIESEFLQLARTTIGRLFR